MPFEEHILHGLAPGTFERTFRALQRLVDPRDWPALELELHALLLGMSGTTLDITQRQRTEAALVASEERNRLALQAARMGTFDRDPLHDDALTWSAEME